MLIFLRKRLSEGLMKGAPTGAVGAVSDNGWTDSTLSVKWLKHFPAVTKCSRDDPRLVIMDGHNSHSRCVPLIWLQKMDHTYQSATTLYP